MVRHLTQLSLVSHHTLMQYPDTLVGLTAGSSTVLKLEAIIGIVGIFVTIILVVVGCLSRRWLQAKLLWLRGKLLSPWYWSHTSPVVSEGMFVCIWDTPVFIQLTFYIDIQSIPLTRVATYKSWAELADIRRYQQVTYTSNVRKRRGPSGLSSRSLSGRR
jgi:hypothetical protein